MTVALDKDEPGPSPLAAALKERHVAMIALGGVIGAGLFVGSERGDPRRRPRRAGISYAIAGAIVFLVMRMLGEMAVARPGPRLVQRLHPLGARAPRQPSFPAWLYWYFWIIAVGAETIAGAALLHDWIALPVWMIGLVLIAVAHRDEPHVGESLWRVRVLVLADQGAGDRRLHPRSQRATSASSPSRGAAPRRRSSTGSRRPPAARASPP